MLWLILVAQTKIVSLDRIFRDPALVTRIPLDIKNAIDQVVANKLDALALTHFDDTNILTALHESVLHESSSLVRTRREGLIITLFFHF